MKLRVFLRVGAVVVVACAVAACGGGHLGGSTVPQSGHRATLDYSPGDTLYVSAPTVVDAFAIDAANTTPPARAITPHANQTGLSIAGIATDVSGQLEVLQNRSAQADCRIVIETPSANGTSAAAGQFQCNATASGTAGYVAVKGFGIARDPSGVAYLEAVNNGTQYGDFVQRANTDTSPAGTAPTGPTDNGGADGSSAIALSGALGSHHGIAGAAGGHIYVSSTQYGAAQIDNFLPGAHGSTPATHTFTLSGRVSAGVLALSANNTLYVATKDGSGNAYVDGVSANSVGSVTPGTSIGPMGQNDITALAVDAQGNIYVGITANASAPGGAASSTHVRVYAPGATGKATPVRILQNPVPSGQPITGLAIAQAPYAAQPAPSPMPSSSPAVTEYNTPTGNAEPEGIAAGPDGALWFTEANLNVNKIGRISPAGVATEYPIPTASSEPLAIAAGPDGALWFTETNAAKVGRITTGGVVTEFSVSQAPTAIAAGPDGAMWFTEIPSMIGRITTADAVTEYPLTANYSNARPFGIVAGRDGALWFTEVFGNNIGRITTGGTINEYPVPTASSAPTGIAAGPDGALWFTEQSGNKIGRITTGGVVTNEYGVSTSNVNLIGITAGPDGALWFTEANYAKIGRITTAGAITEYGGLLPAGGASGITAGPDGAVWFADGGANAIGRIK